MSVGARLARLAPGYLARLVAPTGHGDLPRADLGGEVGSIVGGGGVRVLLAVRGGRVADASFRALGSEAARGPGSVLVERLQGATLEAARALRPEDLLAPLGPVPTAVARAAGRCVEALGRALDDGAACARADAPGLLTCRCLGVGDRTLRRAIATGACTVPMLGLDTGAGTGCHACWPDLRALLHEARPAPTPAPGPAPTVLAAVAALVGPLWAAQGLTLTDVVARPDGPDGAPTLGLGLGAVARDAMASPIGAVALAQHLLREVLDDGVRVGLAGGPG